MADSTRNSGGIDRREFLTTATLASAGSLLFGSLGASAAAEHYPAIRKAAEAGRDAAIKRIQDWIALPSIAAENRSMKEGAEYMANLAREAGFDTATIVPTDGHPGVFATMDNGAKRTLALYFMYDVKQFDPAEWSSPPLEARIVDKPGFGRAIVGRGAVNQKGPEATVLSALHAMRAAKAKLPVNLVLVAEGEEEIGSPHFHQIVQRPEVFAALKKAEGIFIPASWQDMSGNVAVNLGSKGVIELELVASGEKWGRGPKGDIHSSQKAMVDSPVWRLVHALDTLVTPDGNTPAIDGWFENVRAAHAAREGTDRGERAQQQRRRAEETARREPLDRRPALSAGARATGLAADGEHRRARRRLHRPGRQDDSAGTRGREARPAPGAESDARRSREESCARISTSAASATSR